MSTLVCCTYDSPVGELSLVADHSSGGLVALLWPSETRVPLPAVPSVVDRASDSTLAATADQLDEYFAGTRKAFDLPLEPQGTDFQREAWLALRTIPYGQTRSYAQQAEAIGRPKAVRAIGAANGRNPISIIVPCHRVIGTNGSLTGFGGGLDAKSWLLRHETLHQPADLKNGQLFT
jgi:methylated-DNA-[protein]-cysteine S-methyltransferase